VNYTLGASAVQASAEQTRGDAVSSLKLTYDFADPNRDYLSYYHLGDAVPGPCESVSFWLWGDASGCRLVLSLQDARDRWFEREVGVSWTSNGSYCTTCTRGTRVANARSPAAEDTEATANASAMGPPRPW
jgi:hypothetical protein